MNIFHVEVTGTPAVGNVLTAAPVPAGSPIQWLRDNDFIPGATGQTYTITTADQGHDITPALLIPVVGAQQHVPAPLTSLGVRITTTGATFAPKAELASSSAATLTWTCEETGEVRTGTSPSFGFSGAATRHVVLTASGGGGLADVVTLNLGFDNSQDSAPMTTGFGPLDPSYNKAPDDVSAIENVNRLTGLKRFMASNTRLASVLDFSGCAALEYVECYASYVQGAVLTGCAALKRLDLEMCDLRTPLDLNPVASTLLDLRAAAQKSGSLVFAPQDSDKPMAVMFHECIHDQTITNRPADLPVAEQLWIYNGGQSGALVNDSPKLTSVDAYINAYSSADFTGAFLESGSALDMRVNQLTTITLTGCHGLTLILLDNNKLTSAAINAVLAEVDSWNTSNGRLSLLGANMAGPNSTGQGHVTTLEGRGWTVNVNPPSDPAPANTAAPAITGTATTGQTLTCSTGTWTNPVNDTTYQWKRNGTPISGETANTHLLVTADEGASLKCTVTAHGPGGDTPADSNVVTPGAAPSGPTVSAFLADFEGGTLTGFTTPEAGTVTVATGTPHGGGSGKYMNVASGSSGGALVRRNAASGADWTTDTLLRAWLRLNTIAANSQLFLLKNANGQNVLEVDYGVANHRIEAYGFRTTGGSLSVSSPNNAVPIDSTWHKLEVRIKTTSSGLLSVSIDGAAPAVVSGDFTRLSNPNQLQIWLTANSSNYDLDDLEVLTA
jgi:hypothetical protein